MQCSSCLLLFSNPLLVDKSCHLRGIKSLKVVTTIIVTINVVISLIIMILLTVVDILILESIVIFILMHVHHVSGESSHNMFCQEALVI